jgi:starch synthase (maltosyl-transferring)
MMEHTRTAVDSPPAAAPQTANGRQRVIVERLRPEIDAGRFPVKRTPGEVVTVVVDMFADGHDLIAGVLKYRFLADAAGFSRTEGAEWNEIPLTRLADDAWTATFPITQVGRYEYTVEGWVDRFASWRKALVAKADAGQDVSSELLEGADLIQAAVSAHVNAKEPDGNLRLLEIADLLRSAAAMRARVFAARDETLLALLARSSTPDPSRSGTFREAESRLHDIAAMGFDVVYLPPIHPIGRTHRKGRNNSLTPEPGDPGSPWAIGADEGGHTAIEPGLGGLEDFDRFVATANRLGLEVALDIAFQASPDHPWVREHPEWFKHRPDGSIKYAENPPKKYQDIYPLDFDSTAWPALWAELANVFRFWIGHGVTIFRVDNPHTKAFRFWEWCIAAIKREHPDAIFLSEAFTRPKVMGHLAKAGFTQSYTYFTWRNTAHELREYLTELTTTELQQYLRPNFFANTPDILHEYLQHGGRPAFEVRLVLAATLAASYGIYSGYELCENAPARPGSEEYLDSEKYQIKPRDWTQPGSLRELIGRVNQIRQEYRALQQNGTLRFHHTNNDAFLFYSKSPETAGPAAPEPVLQDSHPGRVPPEQIRGRVFVVANTDPHHLQHGWVEMPVWELGLAPGAHYVVEDLLDGARYLWQGAWNYVRLDPGLRMAHIFVIKD